MKARFFIQQINYENRTAVLVGCIPYTNLRQKAKFSFIDESDNSENYYQRKVDEGRTKSIADYIKRSILSKSTTSPVFPTSIIIAFDNDGQFFNSENHSLSDIIEISLPDEIMIVDGQHRLAGMNRLYESVDTGLFPELRNHDEKTVLKFLNSYKFNCSVLLNYDLWQQAQVFASVNFNQRRVNKSLFYQIYGIKLPEGEPTDIPHQNEIYIAHKLVDYVNRQQISPLKGMVRMLGSGGGNVSQAFLVERLVNLLSPFGIWSDVTQDVKSGGAKHLIDYALVEFVAYLIAIRNTFIKYWPKDVEGNVSSILCKTTGMGALLRLLPNIHSTIPNNTLQYLKSDPQNSIVIMSELFYESLSRISLYENKFFGKNSQYSKGGGVGLQSQLYNEMYRCWSSGQ